jgi:hypothetical protein
MLFIGRFKNAASRSRHSAHGHRQKNWLFIGDANTRERSAIIHTLVENCYCRRLDPFTYLRDMLTRLSNMTNRQIPEVTPQTWNTKWLQVQPPVAS